MQSVNSRIENLERATGAGACEACGTLPDGSWPQNVRVLIDTNRDGKPFEPEYCPKCGNRVNFTLDIATAGRGDQ